MMRRGNARRQAPVHELMGKIKQREVRSEEDVVPANAIPISLLSSVTRANMGDRRNGDLRLLDCLYRARDHTTRGSSSSTGYNTSAGTIVSSGYSSNSSRLSSSALEAAIQLDMVELDEDRSSSMIEMEKKDTEFDRRPIKKPRKKMEKKDTATSHAEFVRVIGLTVQERCEQYPNFEEFRRLVRDLFDGLAANGGDHISVVEVWLEHLGVGWLLQVTDDASPGKISLTQMTKSWFHALAQIKSTMHHMVPLFPSGWQSSICEEVSSKNTICEEHVEPQAETESGKRASVSFEFHYTQFILQTMFKMLAFVDVIVGPNTETTVENLRFQVDLHSALSGALPKIRLPIESPFCQEVESMQDELDSLLSANVDKTSVAIWSIMEHINKTVFLESIEDRNHSSSSLTPQGSSEIHEATRSVNQYIILLNSHHYCLAVANILSAVVRCGKYVPQIRDVPPLTSMIIEVASCLEEKLAKRSESSFQDHSRRFLFLLNNLDFILETLGVSYPPIEVHVAAALTRKLEAYTESYLQVSWEPLFSCLLNPTPLRNKRRRASLLTKFEFAFQKTYTTQKHWKVPNPKLRERLRKSIVEKNTPIYIKYIEDSKVTNPKFTPKELEEMLLDLFEG